MKRLPMLLAAVALSTGAFARTQWVTGEQGAPAFLSDRATVVPSAWQQPAMLTERPHKIRLEPYQGPLQPLFLPMQGVPSKKMPVVAPLYLHSGVTSAIAAPAVRLSNDADPPLILSDGPVAVSDVPLFL